MKRSRDPRLAGLALVFLVYAGSGLLAGGPATASRDTRASPAPQAAGAPAVQPATLSDADIETFLRTARVVRTRSAGKGVTDSIRATLSDGTLTHDAHVQNIEVRRDVGPAQQGAELNFRDSWTFNVAAYKLDRLIALNMVPVSVERRHGQKPSAFTWWVDDVLMDEGERIKQLAQPPSPVAWNEAMQLVRLFDQLIYNVDRNQGNLLITKDWRVWAIDHTRAFRLHKTLKRPESIVRCDRAVFEGLKRLDAATLEREMGKYLSEWEREALLARRDAIVAIIEQGGELALFDRRR